MSTRETVTCVEVRNELTDYLENALSEGYRNDFERHLDRCCSCRNHLGEMLDCIEELGRLRVDDLTPEREAELVALISDRREQALEVGGAPEARAEEMLEELMAHSPEQRAILLRNCGRFRSVGLCEMALDRGFELGVQHPPDAVSFALIGVIVADCLDVQSYPTGFVYDLRARAYSCLGNAQRICSDLEGAERSFAVARDNLKLGSHRLRDEAVICDLEAAFLAERRHFSAALDLLDVAIGKFAMEVEKHLEGRSWLSKSQVLGAMGRVEEAIKALERGVALVDPDTDPRLTLLAKHNLLVLLREEGRFREVAKLLPETREIHSRLGNAVDLMRFRWLEGEVAVDSGRLSEAESVFLEVKQFFVDKGMAHDVAFVSLDLALVYLKQGRIVELKALAAEMLTIFRALKIPEEALAALIFCQKAAEMESLTFGVVNELVARLEEARRRSRFGVGLSVTD